MSYRIGQVVATTNRTSYEKDQNGEYSIVWGNGAPPPDVMNSIVDQYGIDSLSHIGIQARPGSVIALDDEIIIIGRSGSYELFNDLVTITSIKILSPGTYIVDFRY